MVVFLYLANTLYLISYGVRDVLLLRVLAVVAMIVFMPYYFYFNDDPNWPAIYWNLGFMAINGVWIIKIILERRPPRLTPDQRKLYELSFRGCTPREMLSILEHAAWLDAPTGFVLVQEGEVCQELLLVHTGWVSVRRRGKELTKVRDGDFVGETSYLTGEAAATTAIATSPVRYVRWTRKELEQVFQRRIDLKSALTGVLGNNLVEKLTSAESRLPELSVMTSG